MGKQPRIEIKSQSYRGVSVVPLPQNKVGPDERGLYDLRPLRFAALDGTSAVKILKELANLPENPKSAEVEGFIVRFHNLELGGSDSGGHKAERMTPEQIITLRNRYRKFWLANDDAEKSRHFLKLLGPWPEALDSPLSKLSEKDQQRYLVAQKSLYPLGDYRFGALRLNWKTGQFTIAARGLVDWLTHAIFQHRNRLRGCSNPNCKEGAGDKRLFIAAAHELFCSSECKLEGGRARKRKWKRKRDAGLKESRRFKGM
jgi:hypothetical protein